MTDGTSRETLIADMIESYLFAQRPHRRTAALECAQKVAAALAAREEPTTRPVPNRVDKTPPPIEREGSYADASPRRKLVADALRGFHAEVDDPLGWLILADRVLAALAREEPQGEHPDADELRGLRMTLAGWLPDEPWVERVYELLTPAAREDTERPDGMPVFTIKAQDDLALRVVSAYRELCVSEGLSEQAYQVAKAIGEITEWRIAHPERCKLPDHTHVPVFRNSGTVDEYLAAGGKIETITDNLEDALGVRDTERPDGDSHWVTVVINLEDALGVRDTERPDGPRVGVREVGADDVRVGDVVWCGGWRKVIEVLPRGSAYEDSDPRFVFEDSVQPKGSVFRGVLSADINLVRDTEQEHER